MLTIRSLLVTLILYYSLAFVAALAQDWQTYRHDTQRTGTQPVASNLSDPKKIATLSIRWSFPGAPQAGAGPFVDTFTGHDQQHFAYKDTDGGIWDAFYCPECSGEKWQLQKINMGGVTSGPAAVSGPFIDTYAEANQQHFAYLAQNGEIWDAFYCPDCSGNNWRLQKINMGGVTNGPPAGEGLFVNVYSGHNQQHFAYKDTDGGIWDAFYCPDCSGNKWQLQEINQFGVAAPPLEAFTPSPIVVKGTVFVGNANGRFYAIDSTTGTLKWQYPVASDRPLGGTPTTATYWDRSVNGAVIFGAPDPSLDSFGSSRLFALDALSGTPIWKSETVAKVEASSGCNDLSKLRQIIHYSPPLLFNNKVYVGIQSNEAPVQVGRVVAVDLNNGQLVSTFKFQAVGTPASPPGSVLGGGVWNAPATDDATGIYITTGNVATQDCPAPHSTNTDPNPNHGLSMIRVDKDSGNIIWAFQAVPYSLDDDPDWAAGATIMSTSCGKLITSVQKDGWSYAVNAGSGTPGAPGVHWQFPPTGFPFTNTTFTHGDDGYRRPGAAWGDVFIVTTGGEARTDGDNYAAGYNQLHALNACPAAEHDRVRWIATLDTNADGRGDRLSAPSVTGGIVFIGTNKGHLIVLGDPSVTPGAGFQCSDTNYTSAASCSAHHFNPKTPVPTVLKDVALPDGGSIVGSGMQRNEPVLAEGKVFVGTNRGHVYMLEP
jgi:outer membrane protein assembly factor BamB